MTNDGDFSGIAPALQHQEHANNYPGNNKDVILSKAAVHNYK